MINLISLAFNNIYISLSCVVVIFWLWLYYRLTFWKRQNVPQSLFHMVKVITSPQHLADQKLIREKGKLVGTYEIIFPTIILADPEMINEVLIKNFQQYANHRNWLPEGAPFIKSLFFQPYHLWKPTRAILSPLFTNNNMKKMQHLVEDATNTLMSHIDKGIAKDKEFDLRDLIEGNMMDVITRSIFGTVIDSVNDPENPIVTHARLIFGTDINLSQMLAYSMPNLIWKFGYTAFDIKALYFLTNLSNQIIKERANQVGNNHRDILQQLIDTEIEVHKEGSNERQKLTTKEIIDNCILFFIAGYDTTATTLTNAIYNLAKYPEVQELVSKEINEELDPQNMDYDTMNKMKYLDAFLNESMRILPSVTRIERKAVSNCHLNGVFIPKDTYITIPIWTVHHDPANYDEPGRFKIERFFVENRKDIRPGTYIPFADGPRNCIGMRFALVMVKICLVKLLQKYKFIHTENTKHEPLNGRHFTTPRELILKVEKRN